MSVNIVASKLLDENHKDADKVRQGLAALDMDPVLELQVYYDELISKSTQNEQNTAICTFSRLIHCIISFLTPFSHRKTNSH